jgi:hypothetical protein
MSLKCLQSKVPLFAFSKTAKRKLPFFDFVRILLDWSKIALRRDALANVLTIDHVLLKEFDDEG